MWDRENGAVSFSGEEESISAITELLDQKLAFITDDEVSKFVSKFRQADSIAPTGRYENQDSGAVLFLEKVANQVNQARRNVTDDGQIDEIFVQEGNLRLTLGQLSSLRSRNLNMGYEDIPLGTFVRIIVPLSAYEEIKEFGVFTLYYFSLIRSFLVLSPDNQEIIKELSMHSDINDLQSHEIDVVRKKIAGWIEEEIQSIPVYETTTGENTLRWTGN